MAISTGHWSSKKTRNNGDGYGAVYKITPSGKLTTVLRFDGTDGASPAGALIVGADGDFYGTTAGGGGAGRNVIYEGTVFKITPSGVITTLHSFAGPDGRAPSGALVQGTDGDFYGTTELGGAGGCAEGCGTVFKITPNGALTTLHSFVLTDG